MLFGEILFQGAVQRPVPKVGEYIHAAKLVYLCEIMCIFVEKRYFCNFIALPNEKDFVKLVLIDTI